MEEFSVSPTAKDMINENTRFPAKLGVLIDALHSKRVFSRALLAGYAKGYK
jgi:hypothetical protein